MLPNETEFKRTGTLMGQEVTMTFDEDSLGFLADTLINLYSDKERAVIREYATNARDSHIEAGQTRPIEISTPNYLSYTFKVKDYGVGLSKQDIIEIYSKYGASTKRNTNKQAGMLGLGCKSALTYSDQFSIIAVKDGIKINVAVSRAEGGGGTITIVSETQTSEPNSVEIIVPVNKYNDFKKKAQEFFQYWGEDEVLIDGKKPPRPKLQKITDRIFLKENPDYYEKSFVVMGGIPYEIDPKQFQFPKGFVGFVDIGEVNFTPPREHLKYTQKTKETLTTLLEEYKENVLESVQAEIDAQTSRLKVAEVFERWSRTLRNHNITIVASDFTYKGDVVKIEFDFAGKWSYGTGYTASYNNSWYTNNIHLNTLARNTIVTGFEGEKLTSYQKQKLQVWADENGQPYSFFFCKKLPDEKWLEEVTKVDWSDILAIKISREGGPAKPKGSPPTYERYLGGYTDKVVELDKTKPIWYSTKAEWRETTEVVNYMSWFDGVQFVFVGANRLNKFMSLYPNAIPLKKAMRDYVQDYVDNMSDDEKALIDSDYYERQKINNLDSSRVRDPDLALLIDLCEDEGKITNAQSKWEDMGRLAWRVGLPNAVPARKRSKNDWLYERYPLFLNLLGNIPYLASSEWWNDVYLYLNTAYEVYKSNKGEE